MGHGVCLQLLIVNLTTSYSEPVVWKKFVEFRIKTEKKKSLWITCHNLRNWCIWLHWFHWSKLHLRMVWHRLTARPLESAQLIWLNQSFSIYNTFGNEIIVRCEFVALADRTFQVQVSLNTGIFYLPQITLFRCDSELDNDISNANFPLIYR